MITREEIQEISHFEDSNGCALTLSSLSESFTKRNSHSVKGSLSFKIESAIARRLEMLELRLRTNCSLRNLMDRRFCRP